MVSSDIQEMVFKKISRLPGAVAIRSSITSVEDPNTTILAPGLRFHSDFALCDVEAAFVFSLETVFSGSGRLSAAESSVEGSFVSSVGGLFRSMTGIESFSGILMVV